MSGYRVLGIDPRQSRRLIQHWAVFILALALGSIFVPGAAAANVTVTDLGPGYGAGVALGLDGRGLIAWLDSNVSDTDTLTITHCSTVACTSHTSVHFSVIAGIQDPAIAIGSDGRGIIAYTDGAKLKTVHCNNSQCTSLSHTTHQSSDAHQVYPPLSIAIDGAGLAMISYLDPEEGAHKLARCTNLACTSVKVKTIAPAGETFFSVSSAVTTGADGAPLVAFQQVAAEGYVLKVFRCRGTQCLGGSTSLLASSVDVEHGVDIATGADGLGLVVYAASTDEFKTIWKVAHCSNASCSAATKSSLDSVSPAMHGDPSIAMRAGGGKLPVIAYGHSAGPQIRLAYCTNTACTLSLKLPLYVSSSLDELSQDAALTLDTDDRPLFVFRVREPEFRVRVGHCNVKTCL